MRVSSTLAPSGRLGLTKNVQRWPAATTLRVIVKHGLPRPGLAPGVAMYRLRNLPNLMRGARRVLLAQLFGIPTQYGALYLTKIENGKPVQLGLVSLRVVTTAGVTKIVDFLRANDTSTGATFKYHGFGTGTTAEASGDTALVTELTTEYVVNSTRPTGTQTNNGATVYETVATLAPDSGGTLAITEHGVFSASSAGTLLDRSKFSAVNLTASADSLVATYDHTQTAGS